MQFGPIDPDCVSDSNSPPKLNPQQAATWTWKPDAATWAAIQSHSAHKPATATITGYRDGNVAYSQSHVTFTTSTDEVSAPIFYRDVPLMPASGNGGAVAPLAQSNIHLIHWRIRDIRKPESHTVLKDMPTCANCHSFSADGKTFGMDIDGPANDKGLYAVVPVQKHMVIQSKDMVHWNTDGKVGTVRVGFMSQVSPNGQYVLSTFAGPELSRLIDSYYVTNFMDYRFLQVFFPTRGILEYYNRATGLREPLPGADDPKYVQTDGVWSPDGKYIVFARAEARDPRPPGQGRATHANDANEAQIQVRPLPHSIQRWKRRNAGADQGRFAERNEQQLPQGLAGRQMDCLRAVQERPADAPRQPALHHSRGRWTPRADCEPTRD